MPDLDVNPGLTAPMGRNSVQAELAPATFSRVPTSTLIGAVDYNGKDRPRCWFNPQLDGPF